MIKLIIKDRGHFVEFPRVAPFRTPAKVDITNIDLNLVMIKLRKMGIENYEIRSGPDIIRPKRSKPVKQLVERYESANYNELRNRFDKFEELLQVIVDKEPTIHEVKTFIEGPKKEVKIEELDELDDVGKFIPDVDTSRMKIRTSGFKIEKADKTIIESAKSLSEIDKKKGNKIK